MHQKSVFINTLEAQVIIKILKWLKKNINIYLLQLENFNFNNNEINCLLCATIETKNITLFTGMSKHIDDFALQFLSIKSHYCRLENKFFTWSHKLWCLRNKCYKRRFNILMKMLYFYFAITYINAIRLLPKSIFIKRKC